MDTWLDEKLGDTVLIKDMSTAGLYLTSLYWSLVTMTTVGYGDIKATNRPELIMSIINMLIGTSFFTYVTATVTSIISDSDYKMNEYRRFMSSLQYFSGEAKISRSLSNELTKQLSLRWKDEFQKFATWNELRQWVAHDTQYKITLAMYGEEFKHSIFITQIQ